MSFFCFPSWADSSFPSSSFLFISSVVVNLGTRRFFIYLYFVLLASVFLCEFQSGPLILTVDEQLACTGISTIFLLLKSSLSRRLTFTFSPAMWRLLVMSVKCDLCLLVHQCFLSFPRHSKLLYWLLPDACAMAYIDFSLFFFSSPSNRITFAFFKYILHRWDPGLRPRVDIQRYLLSGHNRATIKKSLSHTHQYLWSLHEGIESAVV